MKLLLACHPVCGVQVRTGSRHAQAFLQELHITGAVPGISWAPVVISYTVYAHRLRYLYML